MGVGDFDQRDNVILFFGHGLDCAPCRQLMEHLAQGKAASELDAEVLVILPAPPPHSASLSGLADTHLLIDADGALRRRYASLLPGAGPGDSMLFVIDRFGTPYAAWYGANPVAREVYEEAAEWLSFVALQCPE
jgi:hypothetical protein